jgi:hypothetical protein
LRILAEADRSVGGAGGIGAIVRRDGLSVAALPDRRQPAAGVFAALSLAKRGRKTAEPNPLTAEFAPSRRDNVARKPRWSAAKRSSNFKKSCGT